MAENKTDEVKELSKVETFIKGNPTGVTAVKIAGHLGFSLEGDARKSSLTKVRRLARKAVDDAGEKGDRTQKEGKEKLYKIAS